MNEPMAMAYIARAACCGNVVVAVVDNPEHARDTAREVARCVREGLAVERVPVEQVRHETLGCRCKPKRRGGRQAEMAL